jgi:plastocyanin
VIRGYSVGGTIAGQYRRRRTIAGILLIAVALASCGGSGSSASTSSSSGGAGAPATTSSSKSSGPASSSQPLQVAAAPSGRLAYIPKVLRSKSGKVTIDFTNDSLLLHNLTIASKNGKVLGATPTFQGGTQVLTIKLKPGTYTFYCTVPGHRAAGMQGTLIVH